MSFLIVSTQVDELESPSLVLVQLTADLCPKEVVAQEFHFVPPVALAGLKLLFHVIILVLSVVDSTGAGILQCHAVSLVL